MRSIYNFLFLLFILILNPNLSHAEQLKIFYVDIDKIIKESNVGKKVEKDYLSIVKKKNKEFEKIEENLKKKDSDLIKQKNILSKEELSKKIKSLEKEINNYRTDKRKFNNEVVTSVSLYGSMVNSLKDEDVRITDRISLPRKRLKGFQYGAIGPVDSGDYVGGNYASVINFSATLPMILSTVENVDVKYFLDVGNLWGVDYSSSIDDSNKIRSSTGIGVDWFTPIGPMTLSIAQDLSKANTDKTESFQFNLGTTF